MYKNYLIGCSLIGLCACVLLCFSFLLVDPPAERMLYFYYISKGSDLCCHWEEIPVDIIPVL